MNGNPSVNGDLANIFGTAFDSSVVEPQADFEAIPPCKPLCLINRAEVKLTKAQTGHYLELEMTIQEEGPYKNRKLWDCINIANPSVQCVEIGLRTLSALARAINVPVISDSAQVVNHFVVPSVKVDKDGRNCIRTYSAPDAAQQQGAPVSQPAQVATVMAPAPPEPASPAPAYMNPPVAPAAAPVTPATPATDAVSPYAPVVAPVAPQTPIQPGSAQGQAPAATKLPWAR